MISSEKLKKIILLVSIQTLVVLTAFSQDNTLLYLQGVPQRYFTNPASQPECNIFFGLPGFSADQLYFGTKGFTADQLIVKDPETDSLYGVFQRPDLRNQFVSNLDKVNYISLNEMNNLISFGFRTGKMYFTLDYTLKLDEKISIPKDLFYFIPSPLFEKDANYDLSSLNIDFTSYSELGIGISRQFNEQLSVGVRPKMLFGLATVSSSGTDISVITGQRETNITAKSELNVCVPWINIPVDENNIIDINNIESDTTLTDYKDYLRESLKNMGYGIDAGVNYKPYRKLEISASIVDFGFIKWKNETHSVSLDGNYKWEGIEENYSDTIKFRDFILDSLKNSFKVTGSDQSFTTYLNSKVFVGGRYFLTPSFDLGAISRLDFFKKDVTVNVILLANWRPSTAFNISASYSILDESYKTFGLGFTCHFGPLSLYMVSDDLVPNGSYKQYPIQNTNVPVFKNMQSYNLRFGLNLVFGTNKIKKLMADKPMYYSTEY